MSVAAKIWCLILGLLLQVGGILVMAGGSPMPGIAVMAVGAMLLAPLVAEPLAGWFAGIVMPRGGAELPAEFSRLQALERAGEYDAALAELEAVIAARPNLLAARAYRIRLLHEHFAAAEEVLALIRTELAATAWQDEHHRLALLAVDLLLEQERRHEAIALLQEVQSRPRTVQSRHELEQRLASLLPS